MSKRSTLTPHRYSKAIRSEERKLAAEMARLFKVHLDAQRRGAEAYARTWLRRVGGAKETATEKAVAATDLQAGLGGAAGTDMGGATTAVAKAEEPSLKAIKKAIERALSKDILASMRKGINVGAKPVAAAFGIGFKESDPKVVEFLADHRTRLEDVMDDYSAEVTKKAISEAYEEGLGEQGIVKAIRDAAGWSEARAQRVGRTESHVATQFGAQEAAEQAGVETKTWITSGDDRVRESHREANGQKRDIDEPFDVGDAELMYPGDPEGGADEPGEVISCRCVTGFGFKKSLSSASASLTKSLSPSGDAGAVELVKGGIAALPDRIVIDAPDDASPIKAVSGEGSEATYDADTATLRIGPTAKAEDVADAIVEHLAAGLLTDEEADELEDELDDAGFPTEAEPGRASAAKRVADLALGRSLSKGMGEDQSIRFALIVQQYGTWPADLDRVRKAFDPNQDRDESGRWTSGSAVGSARIPKAPRFSTEQFAGSQAERIKRVEDAIESARKAHGLGDMISMSSGISLGWKLGIHEGLVALPEGARNVLSERGYTMEIRAQGESQYNFEVGGQRWTATGLHRFDESKIEIWADRELDEPTFFPEAAGRAREIVAHEVGHAVMEGLLGEAAQGEELGQRSRDEARIFRQKEFALQREGKEVEATEFRIKSEEKDGEADRHFALYEKIREFDEATRSEGGVSGYVDSYVKDREIGWRTDIVEYAGALESKEYAGSNFRPRASITRAANEQFAEITSMLFSHPEGSEKAKRAREIIKKKFPKSLKAYGYLAKYAEKKSEWSFGKRIK